MQNLTRSIHWQRLKKITKKIDDIGKKYRKQMLKKSCADLRP